MNVSSPQGLGYVQAVLTSESPRLGRGPKDAGLPEGKDQWNERKLRPHTICTLGIPVEYFAGLVRAKSKSKFS